ncbi:MAG: hypothetical protein ACRCZO_13450 [Cetobacterium sp.]
MINTFFDYLEKNVAPQIISQKTNLIISVKESDPQAILTGVNFKCSRHYKSFGLTLDVNNCIGTPKILGFLKNLFPTVDGVIFAEYSNKIYVIYTELKSNSVNNHDINKKFIHSKQCINFLIENFYLQQNIDLNDVVPKNIDFIHRFLTIGYNQNAQVRNQQSLTYSCDTSILHQQYSLYKLNFRTPNNQTLTLTSFLR